MRKSLIAVLLVLGVAASSASLALSDETNSPDVHAKLQNARMVKDLTSHARNLGTSAGGADLDTTWVGYTPGHQTADNPWSIWAGHGKDGYMRPVNGQPNKGMWDFETPINGDSLQGWWPAHYRMIYTGGIQNDRNRPFAAVDYGNVANYRSNSGKPTYGVLGVWHVDGGSNQAGPTVGTTPTWTPASGAGAAWMGLRAHGDVSSVDPITGNPFNEDLLVKGGSSILPAKPDGNDKGFPGYGSQMDQMLYRDIDYQAHANEDLTVSFSYRTVMSLNSLSTNTTRTGWFDGDPLAFTGGAINPTPNNFISAADAGLANAPVDSFMVYIGTGVDGNQWLGSDGNLHDVFDPQRRWFAEVLHWDRDPGSDPDNPTPLYYKELLSVAGNNPADANTNPSSYASANFAIPYASLSPYLAKNGKIRLVFRVKTNRGSSDESTDYTSGGSGAAVVDNVAIQFGAGAPTTIGAFDSESEINNDANVAATDAWKSTGKPPSTFFHAHEFADLPYTDICGQKGDPGRICDLTGVVVSMGNHDDAENSNGALGTAEQDRLEYMASPTIQLAGPFNGPGGVNAQGLYAAGANGGVGDVEATEDMYLVYDLYAGIFNAGNTGQFWTFGAQSYPAVATKAAPAPSGYDGWGSLLIYGFVIYNPDDQCFQDIEPLIAGGTIATSNPSGIPDSLRVYLGTLTYCFGFGLSTTCGGFGGKYYDNVSVAFVDGTPVAINVDPWMWFQDTFPANEDDNLVTSKALFDTTAALIRIGLNTATVVQSLQSNDVPGDSVWINSAQGTKRMDMVFRVLPGPGNYNPVGDGHNGTIRKVPSNPATVVANDGSWWDVYRRFPGDFATPNAATLLQTAKGGWDPNVWVSARCDTAEGNLWAFQGRAILGGPAVDHDWQSTYHEADPKFNLLGIDHFICFVRCSTCALSDRICDGTVPTVNTPGGYLPLGTPSTTKEGTSIIPDGLLTPGSHVEYFFRSQKQEAPTTVNIAYDPDTTQVFPSDAGASTDGHRWQEFSVLPDRWKDPQYLHPVFQTLGHGPACLLVYDGNDRRGNERVWVSVADTIGATDPQKFGAHNGWHAAGGQDINDPAARVAVHGGSPGTTWDLYQQKASESANNPAGSIGSRLAYRGGPAIVADKSSRQGPTPAMLNQFYTLFLYLSGDLNSQILGPFNDKSADDVGILENWMQQGNINFQTRGFWAMGDGFVEANWFEDTTPAQNLFLSNYLGVGLVDPNYAVAYNSIESVVDLKLQPEWQGKGAGQVQVFGLRNQCLYTNDVIDVDGIGLSLGSVASYYDATTGGAQAPASVFKDWDPTSPWKALTDGWDIEHITTRFDVNTINRSTYFFKIFTNVWAKIWNVAGTPVVPLDVPSFENGNLVNFVNLKNNPVFAGHQAKFAFGLKQSDRVQIDIYDVAGRLVRTLAKRQFEAGPHEIVWDGLDNAGRQVQRGVYFTQVKYLNSGFTAARKLTVLK